MRVLALDFDGVISDSAPECFWVGIRAHLRLHRTRRNDRLAAVADRLSLDGIPDRTELMNDPLYREFLDLMPLGNRAEDFGVIMDLLSKGTEVVDQSDYDARSAEYRPDSLERFAREFYATRYRLSEEQPESWEGLTGAYAPFVELLRGWSGRVVLAIATAKDRTTVVRLLDRYGLSDLIPEERIVDRNAGADKCAHLRQLAETEQVSGSQVTFLDDKVNHLDRVATLGVRCGLASWGYNGDRERRLASQRGYLLCSLDDVEDQLFV